MLEDLSFCDRERALLSVIIKTLLTFAVVNERKRNLSNIFVFSEYAKKKRRSNLKELCHEIQPNQVIAKCSLN